MKIKGMAAKEKGAELEQYEYEQEPGENEILIKVTHCGICHSDVHLIDDDWKSSNYPFVPGHEAVGKVIQAGKNVQNLKEGMRVGVGWQSDSCGRCTWCRQAEENLCSSQGATAKDKGGFATHIVVDSRFAVPIPESLSSEGAAPMLCGGITVYSPLRSVQSHEKVAVIGIGGLGHFALQFASAKGCHVTALSTTPDKEQAARELGADDFILMKDIDKVQGRFDVIINTAPISLEWEKVMSTLRPYGTLVQVGAAPEPLQIAAHTFIGGRRSVRGSNIGSPAEISEMLNFAAQHDIEAVTELYALSDVNDALKKVRKGGAKYRVVLEIPNE